MAYIHIVPPGEADPDLKEVYEETAGRRGSVAEILAVHSLMPETMRSHLRFYMDVMYGKGPLSRLEREAIAVAVSAANRCAYCVAHHSAALGKYLKDEAAVRLVAEDVETAPIEGRLKVACRYARKLTLSPGEIAEADVVALRDAGWDDASVLHIAQVTGYFNFVNRMALGLGVKLDASLHVYKH